MFAITYLEQTYRQPVRKSAVCLQASGSKRSTGCPSGASQPGTVSGASQPGVQSTWLPAVVAGIVDLGALNKSSAKVASFAVRAVNGRISQYTYASKRDHDASP